MKDSHTCKNMLGLHVVIMLYWYKCNQEIVGLSTETLNDRGSEGKVTWDHQAIVIREILNYCWWNVRESCVDEALTRYRDWTTMVSMGLCGQRQNFMSNINWGFI